MKLETRLKISWVIVLCSIVFAVVILSNRDVAEAFALWYVPTVLTLLLAINIWKRPT